MIPKNTCFLPSTSAQAFTGTRPCLRGGGVHHIALDCPDIFDTVAKLRANGVPFVPVSSNYYDDVIARLDIDHGLVERTVEAAFRR